MSFLKTNTFHEPPRYDLGVIPCNDSTWLEIVVNKKYDNQVLYDDCVRNKPPTDVALDMRWIGDIKEYYTNFNTTDASKKLYLIIDDIGCVQQVGKDHRDCNIIIDTDGYVLRRYEQPYNCGNYSNTKNTTNKYYWKRPNCLYNDKIHYKHTKYLCNSLMTYHKQIDRQNNKL